MACLRSLFCPLLSPPTPQVSSSSAHLWPTSHSSQGCPQNTVQQQFLKQPNTICGSSQTLSVFWCSWRRGLCGENYLTYSTWEGDHLPSQFTQVVGKRVSHPMVIVPILRHFTRWQPWSKPVEFIYSIPILSEQTS